MHLTVQTAFSKQSGSNVLHSQSDKHVVSIKQNSNVFFETHFGFEQNLTTRTAGRNRALQKKYRW